MGTEPTIDIAALLEPISGDDPAGVDPREDPEASEIYYDIKDSRAQARAAERQAFETVEDAAEATAALQQVSGEWRAVASGAQTMLTAHSKDIEVATWLIEALVREHGFAGLRDGFRVVTGLVTTFSDSLWPRPEAGETIEETVAPIAGMNGVDADGPLLQPIRMVRLSAPSAPNVAYWHERMAESGSASFPKGAVDAALRASPPSHLKALASDLAEAREALREMDTALTGLCGIDAPPVSRIAEALDGIASVLRRNGAGGEDDDAAQTDAAGAEDDAPGGQTGAPGPGMPGVPGQIRSREEAFAALSRVAAFFRTVEPHSPVSYTLEEIVRRGRMTLPDLLIELMPDETGRHEVLRRLGIAPQSVEPAATDESGY